MNNISNSFETGTVEGLKSESHVYGIGCNSYDTINIFIPSKKLLILNDGSVHFSDHSMPTKKTENVLRHYIDRCNNKEINFDQDELNVLMNQANKQASEKVQIPFNLVEEMDALLYEKLEIENKKKVIEFKIAELSKKFFL